MLSFASVQLQCLAPLAGAQNVSDGSHLGCIVYLFELRLFPSRGRQGDVT
jgi:hypothetical protein